MASQKGVKTIVSIALLVLAFVRLIFYDVVNTRIDVMFLGLLASAFLIHLIPWDNLTTVKAAGVELSIERPQVQAAISGLGLDHIGNEQLKKQLSGLTEELQSIRGSKVLWIDDNPYKIVGVRRLLRALGIHVVSAISSEMAEDILTTDNDFDLVITDIQREGGKSYTLTGGEPLHEGVNFVIKFRRHDDPIIKTLPVIFYAAYDWERLVEFSRPARELQPEPEISNSVDDFVLKVIRRLAIVRRRQNVIGGEKLAT